MSKSDQQHRYDAVMNHLRNNTSSSNGKSIRSRIDDDELLSEIGEPPKTENGRIDFEYTAESGTSRVHRTWINHGNTVKLTENEQYYDHNAEEWKQSRRWSHEWPVDDDGLLIGDGSNWTGDGMLWTEYAHFKHEKSIRLRYYYDFE